MLANLAFAAVACNPDLPSLRYPLDALAQHMMGSLQVDLSISERGVKTIVAANGHPLFLAAAESGIRFSEFASGCYGARFTMRFDFRLDPTLAPTLAVAVRKVAPTEWEIVSPADVVVVTIACPPMVSQRARSRIWNLLARLRVR